MDFLCYISSLADLIAVSLAVRIRKIAILQTANVFGVQFSIRSIIYPWKPDIVTSAKGA